MKWNVKVMASIKQDRQMFRYGNLNGFKRAILGSARNTNVYESISCEGETKNILIGCDALS